MRALAIIGSLLALTCAPRSPITPGAPVIIISIDTLRSDHLPAYGYAKVATPALDALRGDSILFERAYAPCPLTLVSHASLFTGAMPAEHGIRDNMGYKLASQTKTLAEHFAANGYATAGAASSVVLRRGSGIERGFQLWDDEIDVDVDALSIGRAQRDGDAARESAQKWLTANASKPFFLFLHLYEPHTPYDPEEPFLSRYGRTYDAEVATADAIVGRFLEFLRSRNLYDRATIVLLSDHGEGLGDHGEEEHGILLYREALQIPLLLKLPGQASKGSSVATPVQLTDIYPMFVPAAPGISLLDIASGKAGGNRKLYAETYYPRIHFGWSDLHSLITDSHHYIHAPKPELYDLRADGGERNNVLDRERRVYASMRDAITPSIRLAAAPAAIDPEQQRQLASLGYLAAVPPSSDAVLPDPKDNLGKIRDIGESFRSFREQRYGDTIAVTTRLLHENARMADLWAMQSRAFERLGRHDDAIRAAREGLRSSPNTSGFALTVASLAMHQKRYDEAEQHARLAVKDSPEDAHRLLAEIALARKDLTAARAEAERAGGSARTILLGRIAREQGKLDDALRHFDAVLAAGHPPSKVHFYRGDVLASMGRTEEAEEAFRREIALYPSDAGAYRNLILLCALQNRNQEATELIFALERASPSPPSYVAIAEVLRVIGDGRGARFWASRGLARFPGQADLERVLRNGEA